MNFTADIVQSSRTNRSYFSAKSTPTRREKSVRRWLAIRLNSHSRTRYKPKKEVYLNHPSQLVGTLAKIVPWVPSNKMSRHEEVILAHLTFNIVASFTLISPRVFFFLPWQILTENRRKFGG